MAEFDFASKFTTKCDWAILGSSGPTGAYTVKNVGFANQVVESTRFPAML